jgi:hypothetical protein
MAAFQTFVDFDDGGEFTEPVRPEWFHRHSHFRQPTKKEQRCDENAEARKHAEHAITSSLRPIRACFSPRSPNDFKGISFGNSISGALRTI